MEQIKEFILRVWERLPPRWRTKVIVWLTVLVASQIIQAIWGAGVWLIILLGLSIVGALLYSAGIRSTRFADEMLGNVWGYFKWSIVVALLPTLWPALKSLTKGNFVDGLIQLLIIGWIVAVIFQQFNKLPRAMSKLMFQRRK